MRLRSSMVAALLVILVGQLTVGTIKKSHPGHSEGWIVW